MCIGTFDISPNTHPVELINEQVLYSFTMHINFIE